MQVEFQWAEIQPGQATRLGQNICQVSVNADLTDRRIYCFLAFDNSTAQLGAVVMSLKGTPVGSLPIWAGANLPTNGPSAVTVLVGGGTDYTDAIIVNFPSFTTFGGVAYGTQVLQPIRIVAEFDSLCLSLPNQNGAGNFRAFLGCLSQSQ
jgi:hypothetical protein